MITPNNLSINKAKLIGILCALIVSLTLGIISASAFALVFPGIGLWLVILIGIGAAVAEGFIFFHDVPKAFKIFFGKGLFGITQSIEHHLRTIIVTRELLKIEDYSFLTLDKKISNKLKEQKALRNTYKKLKYLIAHPNFFSKNLLKKHQDELSDIQNNLDLLLEETNQQIHSLETKKIKITDISSLLDKEARKLLLLRKEAKQIITASAAIKEFLNAKDFAKLSLLVKYRIKIQLQNILRLLKKNDMRAQLVKKFILSWEEKSSNKDILSLLEKQTQQQSKLKREFLVKKILIGFAVLFALANGIGLGALTFTSCLTFATQIGLTIAIGPFIPTLAAVTLSSVAVFAFSMLMYKMLTDAIENNIVAQTLNSISKMFKSSIPWQELGTIQKFWHIINSIIKMLAIFLVLGISILVIVSTAGTFLQQTLEACTTITHFFIKINAGMGLANKVISEIIVCGSILPLGLMFSLEHCTQGLVKLSSWLSQIATSLFGLLLEFKENPLAIMVNTSKALARFLTSFTKILASLIWLVLFAFFLLHIIGEGAIAAMSSINPTDRFSKTIQRFSQLIHFSPVLFTLILTMVQEMLQDFDYILPSAQAKSSGHQHGVSYVIIQQGLNQIWERCSSINHKYYSSLFKPQKARNADSEVTQLLSLSNQF